ncbi:unnamed protein product [Microthlaspi erraticum]|uniref:Uncharacterized protein n=1 Tax=Microthlaspi erraticum TaxID=1685480 RepID=A0A6D2K637_9BRAS|nr:unnamed protein product [Microthlaspi erraticum]CAA7062269.1 unnamed protein product [Microthlaspi erraticum]
MNAKTSELFGDGFLYFDLLNLQRYLTMLVGLFCSDVISGVDQYYSLVQIAIWLAWLITVIRFSSDGGFWRSAAITTFVPVGALVAIHLMVNQLLGVSSESEVDEMSRLFSDFVDGCLSVPINLPGFTYHKAMKARKEIISKINKTVNKFVLVYSHMS